MTDSDQETADKLFNDAELDEEGDSSFEAEIELNLRQLQTLVLNLYDSELRLDEQILDKKERKYQLDQYNHTLREIGALLAYYKKQHPTLSTEEANFVKYIILRQVNSLNDKFNLNKRLTLTRASSSSGVGGQRAEEAVATGSKISQTPKSSCLELFYDYEMFESISALKRKQIQDEFKMRHLAMKPASGHLPSVQFKLRVRAVQLVDECEFEAADGDDNDNDEAAISEELVCYVFQFESSEAAAAAELTKPIASNAKPAKPSKHRALSRLAKEKEKAVSRRSSSADHHHQIQVKSAVKYDPSGGQQEAVEARPRARSRLRKDASLRPVSSAAAAANQTKTGAGWSAGSSDESIGGDSLWSLRPQDKCIKVDSFSFCCRRRCSEARSLDEVIDLLPSCRSLFFIVYKYKSSKIGQLRCPVKYLALDLAELLGGQSPNQQAANLPFKLQVFNQQSMFETYTWQLSSYGGGGDDDYWRSKSWSEFSGSGEPADGVSASKNSNVFKRMFKRQAPPLPPSADPSGRFSRLQEQQQAKRPSGATLLNSSRLMGSHGAAATAVDAAQCSSISFDLSCSLSEMLVYNQKYLDLAKFVSWRDLWRPRILFNRERDLRECRSDREAVARRAVDFLPVAAIRADHATYSETGTVYLNKLEFVSGLSDFDRLLQAAPASTETKKQRSKSQPKIQTVPEPARANEYYLVRVSIASSRLASDDPSASLVEFLTTSSSDKRTSSFVTSFFKSSRNINEVCSFGIRHGFWDANAAVLLKFEIYQVKKAPAASAESVELTLAGTSSLELKRSAFVKPEDELKTLSVACTPSSAAVGSISSLKVRFASQRLWSFSKDVYSDLHRFQLVETNRVAAVTNEPAQIELARERDLLNLLDSYLLSFGVDGLVLSGSSKVASREPALPVHDIVLARKFLELFSLLAGSTGGAKQPERDEPSNRRLLRRQLLLKTYEAFVRLLNSLNGAGSQTTPISMRSVLGDLDINRRACSQCLVSVLKSLIEEDNRAPDAESPTNGSGLFDLTLQCFHSLVEILVGLASFSNSKYELKYEINDLLSKFCALKRFNDPRRKVAVFAKLNLRFLNSLDGLFTSFELVNLICTKLLFVDESRMREGRLCGDEETALLNRLILRQVNENLLSLDAFATSYQFRDRLVDFLLRKYLDFERRPFERRPSPPVEEAERETTRVVATADQVRLIAGLLKYQSKLSKTNLDYLIKASFKMLVATLIEHLSEPGSSSSSSTSSTSSDSDLSGSHRDDFYRSEYEFVVDTFLTFVDVLDIIISTRSSASHAHSYYIEGLNYADMLSMFEIVTYYLKFDDEECGAGGSANLIFTYKRVNLNRHKLWLKVNLIVVRFAKYIQKHLLRYLITKLVNSSSSSIDEKAVSASEVEATVQGEESSARTATRTRASGAESAEFLIQAYFEMLFTCLDQPNVYLSHNPRMKLGVLNCLTGFWKCLNVQLKRSPQLYEYLLGQMSRLFFTNLYSNNLTITLNFSAATSICQHLSSSSSSSSCNRYLRTKLSPFVVAAAAGANAKSCSVLQFYEAYFGFLNDLFLINLNYLCNVDQFLEFFFLHLIRTVVRHAKSKTQSSDEFDCDDEADLETETADGLSKTTTTTDVAPNGQLDSASKVVPTKAPAPHLNLSSYSDLVLDFAERLLLSSSASSYFINQSNRRSLFNLIRACVDFNKLKEEFEPQMSASILERFVLVYDLVKAVGKTGPSSQRLFTSQAAFEECKRRSLMYLLDELYKLHRLDRNYLQMSFIRKEQADLLKWNLSKSNSNKIELKEVLYLKSLKRFAMSSLRDRLMTQDVQMINSLAAQQQSQLLSSSTASPTGNNNSQPPQNGFFQAFIQTEICKQLCAYYEKIDENLRLTQILSASSKLSQMASDEKDIVRNSQHGHLYFRIGFFGRPLKCQSIRNKYFLYKHPSFEMLSNIQNLMLNKLSYAEWNDKQLIESPNGSFIHKVCLLHHNQEPDASIKQNADTCFIQICALNRIDKAKLIDLIDEMNETQETVEMKSKLNKCDKNAFFYYYDRPFYDKRNASSSSSSSSSSSATSSSLAESVKEAGTGSRNSAMPAQLASSGVLSAVDDDNEEFERTKEVESVENLWIERSVLFLDDISAQYENITQFEEVKSTFKIMLNPIRNAINDINEKTKELKHFVVQFTANTSSMNIAYSHLNIMHNLQPLTMRLLGCLDARVNGGLIKYVKELLNETHYDLKLSKKRRSIMNQLYASIREQLNVLESGLSIHDRILRDVEIRFKDANAKLAEETGTGGGIELIEQKHQKNHEHLKHMNQLNKHLIECLKVIEQELNDRWTRLA